MGDLEHDEVMELPFAVKEVLVIPMPGRHSCVRGKSAVADQADEDDLADWDC